LGEYVIHYLPALYGLSGGPSEDKIIKYILKK